MSPAPHPGTVEMAVPVLAQAPIPTPGVGPDELVDYWPVLTRAAWFLAGFLATVLAGWFLVVPAVSRVVRRRNRNNPTIQEAIPRYTRLLVLVTGFFVAAGTAGYGQFLSDSALVVAAGTLAIGVAGQTVIGSLVSGLVLVTDPEFNVGDYIEWSEGAGTIETITLRVTRVLGEDGELVTVPNTTLTGETITQPYGRDRYRIATDVGLSYDADLAEALVHLETAAADLPKVRTEPPPDAHVDELGDDAVLVRATYWIANPRPGDVNRVQSAFAQDAKRRLEAADIEVSPASNHDLQGHLSVDEGNRPSER